MIGFLFSLNVILKDFIDQSQLTFWALEILYIAIISYWIFKNKIYIHKKVAIGVMIITTIIDFIENFIPNTKHKDLKNGNELTDKNAFDVAIIKYGAYSIPLYYIANELHHIQRDYCWIKSKYLMDIKSLQPYKIFFAISGFGFIFIIIFFSIFTFVPCKTYNNVNKIKDNFFYNNTSEPLKLYLEYCSLKDYDENKKTLYLFYDSIKLISKEYSNTDKNNMLEIFLVIPLYFLFYVVNEISRLLLIRNTEPTNILIYRYFYYFVVRIITFSINEGDEQYFTHTKFILYELEELMGVVSSLIFNELLELKFYGLDYELKKNIERRSTEDTVKGFLFDNETENSSVVELPMIDDCKKEEKYS